MDFLISFLEKAKIKMINSLFHLGTDYTLKKEQEEKKITLDWARLEKCQLGEEEMPVDKLGKLKESVEFI